MKWLLETVRRLTNAATVRPGPRIQSLWGGYGEILRVHLEGAAQSTAVVKWVRPPHLGASQSTRSHIRKLRSYEVELAFYSRHASKCTPSSRVASLLGWAARETESILVLEDLDAAGFSRRLRDPGPTDLDACLRWLARFHACFMGAEPTGLWQIGTYWNLATRPDECAMIDDDALREAAPRVDALLGAARFKTFVHGDAKVANYCFGAGAVAAVDFQYVGGGAGVKDVAYLLCGRWGADCEGVEAQWLDGYFAHLREALSLHRPEVSAASVEREWRDLYRVACVDFYRFQAGWAKSAWAADSHAQRFTREVLRTLL